VRNYVIEPSIIKQYVPQHPDIIVLPWFDEPMELNSDDVETARAIQAKVEAQVEAIGKKILLSKNYMIFLVLAKVL